LRGISFGAAGVSGVVLQNEPDAEFEEGRSETCPTAGLQNEPVDHWLLVCDWVSVRIRSESCFGEEGRSETCPTGALQNELNPDSR